MITSSSKTPQGLREMVRMSGVVWSIGRRFGKTLTVVMWLLEDPDNREVWCSSIDQADQFLNYLMQFEDSRVLAHNRKYWQNRVVIGKMPDGAV
jgi:hypothetical protein